MRKSELLQKISTETGLKKAEVELALDSFARTIREEVLEKNDTIAYPDFGTFKQQFSAEHTGRNPSTGQAIIIPESKKVTFKASPFMVEKG